MTSTGVPFPTDTDLVSSMTTPYTEDVECVVSQGVRLDFRLLSDLDIIQCRFQLRYVLAELRSSEREYVERLRVATEVSSVLEGAIGGTTGTLFLTGLLRIRTVRRDSSG